MLKRVSSLLLAAALCLALALPASAANAGDLTIVGTVTTSDHTVTVRGGNASKGNYIGTVWSYTGTFDPANATQLIFFDAPVGASGVFADGDMTIDFGTTVAAGSTLRVVVTQNCWAETVVEAPAIPPTPVTPTPGLSGGGGGGGGGGVTANVTVDRPANGTVKVSDASAKAGETVTLTLTPNAGYEADTVTVKDKDGGEIAVTKNADGTYRFTMPAAGKLPVTVTAAFKKVAATTPMFIDVVAGSFYEKAVEWAVSRDPQITNGKGSVNTFKPNDVCTRAEAVTFLYRAAGEPDVALSTVFKDVPANAYYTKAVAWAVANGVTNGKNAFDTFKPGDVCSRAEIVTFLARFEKAEGAISSQFIDVPANAYYAGSVGWAVNNGITNGKNAVNTFKPNDGCTRAEIVTFLYRDFVR